MGSLRPSYRLYNCQRCGVQVRICQRCDHGNIYCAGECSRIRRRESLRRAQARYQRTRRGAWLHAARQRCWRARRQEVTHQGCASEPVCGSVLGYPKVVLTDAKLPCVADNADHTNDPLERCSFCRWALPAWARWRSRR